MLPVNEWGFDTWILRHWFGVEIEEELEGYLRVPYESLAGKGLDLPFSKEELEEQISQLVAGKAPGPDGVHPYMLKWAPPEFVDCLRVLFWEVWHDNHIPEVWKQSHVRPIRKKKELSEKPKSYRPIYLISVLGKLFSRLVHARLYAEIEKKDFLPEFQQGFRKKRGCVELSQSTFIAFLDVANAFPTTWRAGMLVHLFRLLGNSRLVRLIHTMYVEDQCRVDVGGEQSDWWSPSSVLKLETHCHLFYFYFSSQP